MMEENKKVYFLCNSEINISDYYEIGGIPFLEPYDTEERMIYDFTPEKAGDVVNLNLTGYPEQLTVSK